MSEDKQQDFENSSKESTENTHVDIEQSEYAKTIETFFEPAGSTGALTELPGLSEVPEVADLPEPIGEIAESEETVTAEDTAVPAEEAAAEESAATEETAIPENDDEPMMPAHFEAIPKEKLAKAKRTRRILVAILVLLILLLIGAAVGAVYYYMNYAQHPTTTVETDQVIDSGQGDLTDRGTTEAIEMPNLAQMFGKTPEEALATLGSDYSITDTKTVEQPDSGSGTAANDNPQANSAARQVVTIGYTPKEQTSSIGTTQVQNIYLTLNSAGKSIEVYFVSSMNLLDYPISSFAELVATKTSFADSLASAGITIAADVNYTAPQPEEYTEYVDPEATNKKIKKESVTFSGTLASEKPPTTFEITYTYDFGASGVEDTPDKQPSQRMLYIKLR